VNLENPSSIVTVISYVMFFSKKEERENIGNTVLIDVDFVGTKISNIVGGHDPLVAMNVDRTRCGANICDVLRVGEQINGALAVE
jgi:hypothetical protein